MNYIILIVSILVLISCDTKTNSKEKKYSTYRFRELNQQLTAIEKKLIGEWGIYSTRDKNGGGVYCNVCPIVSFKANGSAIVNAKEY